MELEEFKIKPNSFVAMHGSFVASHCIKDSLIFLSLGIGCKAQLPFYMGSHESDNNYVSRMGWAELDGDDIINGKTEKIKRNILGQIKRGNANFFPVVISPVVKTIGMEPLIEKTAKEIQNDTGKTIELVKLSGAESDFWEGYNNLILSYIKTINWKTNIEKNTVNIFGYPFDRYEYEHIGNVKEIRKLLAKIGIKVQAIFLSGKSTFELENARKAEYNIILPHAMNIAKSIEKITSKKNIYTDIPFGIKNTENWIKQISQNMNRGKIQAHNFIEYEKKNIKIFIENKSQQIKNKNIGIILDLPYIWPFYSLLKELDANIKFIIIRDRYYGGEKLLRKILKFHKENIDFEITESASINKIITLTENNQTDLVIGSATDVSFLENNTNAKTMIFGFPSYGKHYKKNDYPFLGFEGFKNITNEIIKSLESRNKNKQW